MPGAIDQLLGLIGRARDPQIPAQVPGRLSDADLSRIQFEALQGGDTGKVNRVTEIRERRKADGLPPELQAQMLKAPVREPQSEQPGLQDAGSELLRRRKALLQALQPQQ